MNSSYLRLLIAFTITGVTWWLTLRNSTVGSEWEAVFLVVVGYYFKDRPAEDSYDVFSPLALRDSGIEILAQFALALSMVIGTFFAFILPNFKESISGVWIGAVVLAVGFYFKETTIPELQLNHHRLGAVIAVALTLLTIPLLYFANRYANQAGKSLILPIQWVGLVFVVVVFYFKENGLLRRRTDADAV